MDMMGKTGFRIACLVGTIGFLSPVLTPVSTPALATEQVYHPISPALGGNPANGTLLLSTAQAQGEGVNSGNNGPTINFPNLTPTTPTTGASGSGASGAVGSTTNSNFRNNSLANPLGTSSGRF
jgi:curli production assembly/transport component CsgF